jgi:hypothetical protein
MKKMVPCPRPTACFQVMTAAELELTPYLYKSDSRIIIKASATSGAVHGYQMRSSSSSSSGSCGRLMLVQQHPQKMKGHMEQL